MLKPRLGFIDLTMLIVSMVIGIGIFKTPQIVAQKTGTVELFFAAWILAAIISVFGALTFAEIGARYPVAGGFYKIFSYCYHPAFAFTLNWALVIINASSAASVALIGADYLSPVLFHSADSQHKSTIVVVIVLLLYALNMIGIRSGARTQNILSGLKIILILFFCSAIFFASRLNHSINTTNHELPTTNLLLAFGAGLISVFFTYGGYQSTINFGEDVKEPQRNIPRAIFLALTIILVLYLLINVCYVYVLGFDTVKASPVVAAALARQMFGSTGEAFASVVIFISVLGFLNSAFMYNPRIWYAMAKDKVLPEIFGRVNEKKQVQEFSLTLFTALTLVMFFALGTFEKLLSYVMFTDTISLASAAFCIFILRRKMKREEDRKQETEDGRKYNADKGENKMERYNGFRVWSAFIPIAFILTICFVTVNVIVDDPKRSLIGAIVLAGGFPLYYVFRYAITKNPFAKRNL